MVAQLHITRECGSSEGENCTNYRDFDRRYLLANAAGPAGKTDAPSAVRVRLRRSGRLAAVASDVTIGHDVIVYPSDRIAPGVRVAQRAR
jgi:hypothetical protein